MLTSKRSWKEDTQYSDNGSSRDGDMQDKLREGNNWDNIKNLHRAQHISANVYLHIYLTLLWIELQLKKKVT